MIKEMDVIYKQCEADGIIRLKEEKDIDLISSLLDSAKRARIRIKKDKNAYEKDTKDWTFMFRDNYEILRTLIDAYLLFDKVAISNHQCSNAYLCVKHDELDLDWGILESMRLLRNGINYKGETISTEKWNDFKLKFEVYVNTLMKEIDKKIDNA